MNTLAAEGLSLEQRAHFAEHGWLLLDSVLDAAQCRAYMDAIDSCLEYHSQTADSETVRWLFDLGLQGPIFLSWFTLPGILEAGRQLLGVPRPRTGGGIAAVTIPHPDRFQRREELSNLDGWKWHRIFRASTGFRASDEESRSVAPICVATVTYLTPVSAEHGVTAILEGSHKLDGTYASLKERCSVVQLDAPAGSMIIFSETLIHSATPVFAETTRYALFYDFLSPWVVTGWQAPQAWAESLRDEELRLLFTPPQRGLDAD